MAKGAGYVPSWSSLLSYKILRTWSHRLRKYCFCIALVFFLRTASVIHFLSIMSQMTLCLSSVSSQSSILLSLGFLIIWILVEIVQTSFYRPVRQ